MNPEQPKKHHRTGLRKPGAKRATICLRLTDETKAQLQAQAAVAGLSAGDYVALLMSSTTRWGGAPLHKLPDNEVIMFRPLYQARAREMTVKEAREILKSEGVYDPRWAGKL
jgi:hypothetical protein